LVIVRQDSEVRADGAAWANHGPAQPHDRRSAIDASVVADDGAGLDVRADVYPRAGLELYPARTQAGGPQRGELVLEPQTDASSNPGHAHRRETYKTVFGGSRRPTGRSAGRRRGPNAPGQSASPQRRR